MCVPCIPGVRGEISEKLCACIKVHLKKHGLEGEPSFFLIWCVVYIEVMGGWDVWAEHARAPVLSAGWVGYQSHMCVRPHIWDW